MTQKKPKLKPWDGRYYTIGLGTYFNKYTGKDEIVNVNLISKKKRAVVKSVSPYDIGYLFQYELNKRQMDFLDKIKKQVTGE